MQVEMIRIQQNSFMHDNYYKLLWNIYFLSKLIYFEGKKTHFSAQSKPIISAGSILWYQILTEKIFLLLHLTFMKGEIMI